MQRDWREGEIICNWGLHSWQNNRLRRDGPDTLWSQWKTGYCQKEPRQRNKEVAEKRATRKVDEGPRL